MEQAIDRAEAFAGNEYLLALFQGTALKPADRQKVAETLSSLTGLSVDFILLSNLRVYPSRFRKELMRDERLTVGRLDSRFTGVDADAASSRPSYDPSYAVIQGPYTAAMNHYVRVDLGFESDVPYEILTGRVHPWDMNARNEYLDVSSRLARAMLVNPDLHVFLAEGLYDLATPFAAAEYTLRHMQLEPAFLEHVQTARYDSGHMMYLHDPSRARDAQGPAGFLCRIPRERGRVTSGNHQALTRSASRPGFSSANDSTIRSAAESSSRVRPLEQNPTLAIPARRAASTPAAASSMTTQSLGLTPSRWAARRKTSGSGFPCVTSSPVTMVSKRLPHPSRSRKRFALAIGAEVPAARCQFAWVQGFNQLGGPGHLRKCSLDDRPKFGFLAIGQGGDRLVTRSRPSRELKEFTDDWFVHATELVGELGFFQIVPDHRRNIHPGGEVSVVGIHEGPVEVKDRSRHPKHDNKRCRTIPRPLIHATLAWLVTPAVMAREADSVQLMGSAPLCRA